MLTVIWVLGSMLLMLLIHFLLPLGYTRKGKFIVVVTSGLLAIGGIAAVSSIPLWQTFLVLLALSFLSAYFMDSRLGKVMYTTKELFIEDIEFEDRDSSSILTKQTEETLNIELMDLSELEITALSPSVLKQNEDSILPESHDEDISFLQDREIVSNTETDNEDEDLEVAYLSDIESLLEEEEVDLQEEKLESLDEDGWLDELAELTVINDDEKSPNLETQLDDFELDELFADKEVAVTSDKDGSKPKKVLEFQK
jgi:membrane protein implicated in regulation of membrane protease activity